MQAININLIDIIILKQTLVEFTKSRHNMYLPKSNTV